MADRIRKINVSTRTTVRVVILSDLAASARVQGIDVSMNGTLYAADYVNHIVYKIYEHGTVNGALVGKIATAGDVDSSGVNASTGLTARLDEPMGICVDRSDNIYVVSDAGQVIRRISPSGRSRVFAGAHGTSGNVVAAMDNLTTDGSAVRFDGAIGIDVDKAGIVYVADTLNNRIKKIWPSGKSTVLAGGSDGFANGTGNAAQFSAPRDVCVDNQGNCFVADTGNHRIRKITESGVVTTLAGAVGSGFVDGDGVTARFAAPVRVDIDYSNQFLYVLDQGNEAIRRVNMHGATNTFAPYNDAVVGDGDITVDPSGFVYVLENDS